MALMHVLKVAKCCGQCYRSTGDNSISHGQEIILLVIIIITRKAIHNLVLFIIENVTISINFMHPVKYGNKVIAVPCHYGNSLKTLH